MKHKTISSKGLIFINSLIYIVLAYVGVYFLVHLLQGLFAGFYDIPSVISRDGLQFRADSQDWWYDSVIVTFTSKLVILFILSVLLFGIYTKSIIYRSYLKLLFIWGSFIAFTWMTGEILFGSLLGTGFDHALSWMYIQDTGKLVIIVISLILYVFAAMVFSKAFILSGNIYFDSYDEERLQVIYLYHILLPYVAALAVITLLKLPGFPVLELLSMYSGLIILGILLFNIGKHARLFNQDEKPKPIVLDHKALLTALFFLAAYFVLLENGIHLS